MLCVKILLRFKKYRYSTVVMLATIQLPNSFYGKLCPTFKKKYIFSCPFIFVLELVDLICKDRGPIVFLGDPLGKCFSLLQAVCTYGRENFESWGRKKRSIEKRAVDKGIDNAMSLSRFVCLRTP